MHINLLVFFVLLFTTEETGTAVTEDKISVISCRIIGTHPKRERLIILKFIPGGVGCGGEVLLTSAMRCSSFVSNVFMASLT